MEQVNSDTTPVLAVRYYRKLGAQDWGNGAPIGTSIRTQNWRGFQVMSSLFCLLPTEYVSQEDANERNRIANLCALAYHYAYTGKLPNER